MLTAQNTNVRKRKGKTWCSSDSRALGRPWQYISMTPPPCVPRGGAYSNRRDYLASKACLILRERIDFQGSIVFCVSS